MAVAQLVIAASQDCVPQKSQSRTGRREEVFVVQSAEYRFGTDRIRFSPAMARAGTWKDEAAGRDREHPDPVPYVGVRRCSGGTMTSGWTVDAILTVESANPSTLGEWCR